MRQILLIVSLIGILSCGNNKKEVEQSNIDSTTVTPENVIINGTDTQNLDAKKMEPMSKIPSSSIRMNIFKNTNMSGYGYDILQGEKLYIHQPNIPAVPGNNGFETEEAAKKVAELVIFKIKNNIMPPTIDTKELDSLGVIKSMN